MVVGVQESNLRIEAEGFEDAVDFGVLEVVNIWYLGSFWECGN